jgi:anaerobic selenocysteine-containing dehydrogenase
MLNYLTPHGKWHIHSTYGDTQRMTTLSRGVEPFWMNDWDAGELGLVDNDWVEVYNDHGVVVTRCVVSARIPRGVCIQYHSPERTFSVPKFAPARLPARGRAQQPHPHAAEAEPDGRRLRPVHVPLQLLGAGRLQPRHARARAQAARSQVVGDTENRS